MTEEKSTATSDHPIDCVVMRLKRKIVKRDKKIAGLERRVSELERALGARTIDLQSLSRNVESAVTNALCNVRMIPVFGAVRDSKIVEVRNVDV